MGSYAWWRVRRLFSRPLPWICLILIALVTWWSAGASGDIHRADIQLRLRQFFPAELTKQLQLFPSSNSRIHYVGRWSPAANRLRTDGSFPGVYFDLNVTNTSTVLVSLQNAKVDPKEAGQGKDNVDPQAHSQYSFIGASTSKLRSSAPPISLLALIDDEEYIILPNATALVPIRDKDLDRRRHHTVRIIAPMTDNEGEGVVQLDGVWLDKGGQLLPVEGSSAAYLGTDDSDLDGDGDDIGKPHRVGLNNLIHGKAGRPTQDDDDDDFGYSQSVFNQRKKLVEIVTDQAAHLTNKPRASNRQTISDTLLSGVMGWEYLIGEMFTVDHVTVSSEGMCLVHDCVGGTGAPSGMGDMFFRSGPVGSPHFSHHWSFQSYVPDVMVLNLGASDFNSFEMNSGEYNKTFDEFSRSFEDTYVSLVKAIRSLAYPNHPSVVEQDRLGTDYYDVDAPAAIPIFIMRPFNGEFEHSTQDVVNRLRNEGDKSVFWLDTSGWLDVQDTDTTASDFFIDPNEPMGHPHLTDRGNQKVAIYLHMHLCRYLAHEDDNCAFLPPEVYQGNMYDPSVATLDRYIEMEKEKAIKEIYWDDLPELR